MDTLHREQNLNANHYLWMEKIDVYELLNKRNNVKIAKMKKKFEVCFDSIVC